MQQPVTYQDWLNVLQDSTKKEDIITAARQAYFKINNPAQAQYDVALILSHMYQRELKNREGNAMVKRVIEDKFNFIANQLFQKDFHSIYQYMITQEPELNITKTMINKGKRPPGYVEPTKTKSGPPLGFIQATPRDTDSPPLGFLGRD